MRSPALEPSIRVAPVVGRNLGAGGKIRLRRVAMRGLGVRLTGIAGVVAWAMVTATAALGAGWLTPVPLNSSTGSNVSVAVDGVGNTVAAWQTNPLTGADVVQASRHGFGTSGFSQLPDLANDQGPPPLNNISPVLAMNSSGHGLAVWVHSTDSTHTEIEASPISPGGVVGPSIPISTVDIGFGSPVAAIDDNGDAIVAWLRNGTEVDAVTRSGSTGTFTSQTTLDTNATGRVSVAIDTGGHVLAIWPSSSNNGLAYKRAVAGGTWPLVAEEVFTGGHVYSEQSIAGNASGQLVLAFQDTTVGTVISETTGTVSGGFGATPTINHLSNSGVSLHGPSATVDDGGGAVVGWSDGSAVNFSRRPAGGSFPGPSGVQSITPVPQPPNSFTLAGNGRGEVIAAWYSFETDVMHNVVRAAVLRPGTSNFESSQRISSTSTDAGSPVVVLDRAGDAIVGMQLGLTPAGVGVAVYDGAGPKLGTPTGPSSIKVGTKASFSVTASDAFSSVPSISWSFGDGSGKANGTHVTHTFTTPGRFTLRVTATDNSGNSSTAAITVNVRAPANRCVVPRLKGKTLAQAKRALGKAHCRLGKVSLPKKHKHRGLVVKSSQPRAGAVRPAGTKVALTLAAKRK
jgi:hypothetical protein